MKQLVVVSNDNTYGWYLDGKLIFVCDPHESGQLLAQHLGYKYKFTENFDLEEYPTNLKDAKGK
jgi:hypothetical protein